MPKMKTNKAAARRFKITGTGKILRKQAGKRHINEWMSPGVKRNLRGWTQLSKDQKQHVLDMFPYRNTFVSSNGRCLALSKEYSSPMTGRKASVSR